MVLKLGSTGRLVQELQRFLGINDDGVFGPETEKSVKSWQKTNGLLPDGIVGPKTWNKMGLMTTDISEKHGNDNFDVDYETQSLSGNEYFKGPVNKRWFFLHHTAGWNNPFRVITAWENDDRGRIATEWVLGGQKIDDGDTRFDGTLVRAFPEGGYGWHLGTGDNTLHRESIGVEVCNFGYLTKGGYKKEKTWVALKPNSYYTYVGNESNPSQLVTLVKPFRGYSVWHKYSDKQITTLKTLIIESCEKYNIDPREGLVEEIHRIGGHDAFDLFNPKLVERTPGIWNHTNVRKDKFDMFPQPELIDMLVSL